MPTAADIITYIGVPLAVLGVMPILFTCLKAVRGVADLDLLRIVLNLDDRHLLCIRSGKR